MQALSCYLLRQEVDGRPVTGFDDYIVAGGRELDRYGPASGQGFSAKLYVTQPSDHEPTWAPYLQSHFPGSAIPSVRSASAVLILRLDGPRYFAFTFGIAGRHLLREGARRRASGLRTALNLLYPTEHEDREDARLLGVSTKRHAREVLRSVCQSSRGVTLEDFDLDRFRDIVNGATGRPADPKTWGSRISGGDCLHFATANPFERLGDVCAEVQAAYDRTDYRQRFAWLDDIKPVTDSDHVEALQRKVVEALREDDTDRFHLAPPEVVDWPSIAGFCFQRGGSGSLPTPDPELSDYLASCGPARRQTLSLDTLRRHRLIAVDTDGGQLHHWPIWRCLVGQLDVDGTTYVLDEGDFFEVDDEYLEQLDRCVADLDDTVTTLPFAGDCTEDKYNEMVVEGLSGQALLLHEKTIKTSRMSSRVEICDILLSDRKLVHVKRHLASRGLSHLFAQGAVSAELLQESQEFRLEAGAKVAESADGTFAFFGEAPIDTRRFHVVYAVIARWNGRPLARALPFFSKVNLRQTANDLRSRGFQVSCVRVEVSSRQVNGSTGARP